MDPPIPMSGIGGVGNWRDAAGVYLDGLRHGSGLHRAAMHYGYRIVEDMIDGPCRTGWTRKGSRLSRTFRVQEPAEGDRSGSTLNLNYKIVAQIDEALCIGCQLCHIACWDGAHQCIHLDRVSGPVDGHVEVHAKPHEMGRERIVVTPIPKLDPPKVHVGPYATSLERIPAGWTRPGSV